MSNQADKLRQRIFDMNVFIEVYAYRGFTRPTKSLYLVDIRDDLLDLIDWGNASMVAVFSPLVEKILEKSAALKTELDEERFPEDVQEDDQKKRICASMKLDLELSKLVSEIKGFKRDIQNGKGMSAAIDAATAVLEENVRVLEKKKQFFIPLAGIDAKRNLTDKDVRTLFDVSGRNPSEYGFAAKVSKLKLEDLDEQIKKINEQLETITTLRSEAPRRDNQPKV